MTKMDTLEKDKLRKRELSKLKRLTKHIPEDKKKMSQGLMEQAAFMYATLAELQMILNEDGAVEMFEQGAQRMLREHPAAKTYNSMIKNYTAACKQIFDLLPDDKSKTAADELMEFVKKAKR